MKRDQFLVEGRVFDLIYLYQFLKRLVKPFEKTNAYKLGIIDKEGNVLRKRSELTTSEEKNSYTLFDTLVFNLKKLLGKIPGGKTRFASFAAALLLLKEERNKEFQLLQESQSSFLEDRFTEEYSKIQKNMESYKELISKASKVIQESKEEEVEEITTADVPTTQEPVVSKSAARKYKRRNQRSGLQDKTGPRAQAGKCILDEYEQDDNIERHGDFLVFNVDPDTFIKAKVGKGRFDRYSKFVGEDEYGEKIRQYGREYPKMPVILKDKNSGQLCFLRYGSVAAEQVKKYYNR
jgi:hypothetical protein